MIDPIVDNKEEAEKIRREIKKNQERAAIRGIISAKKAVIAQEGAALQTWLDEQASKMHAFSSTSLVADLKGGFTGKAADSAESALKSVPQPTLTSPISAG